MGEQCLGLTGSILNICDFKQWYICNRRNIMNC